MWSFSGDPGYSKLKLGVPWPTLKWSQKQPSSMAVGKTRPLRPPYKRGKNHVLRVAEKSETRRASVGRSLSVSDYIYASANPYGACLWCYCACACAKRREKSLRAMLRKEKRALQGVYSRSKIVRAPRARECFCLWNSAKKSSQKMVFPCFVGVSFCPLPCRRAVFVVIFR